MKQPELGNTIANLRKQKGLTQEELALRCGLNVKSVQSLESGSVTTRSATIKLLAEELDFEFNDKIDDDSKFWLITLHLSNFFCIVVFPLVIWAWKKDEDPEIVIRLAFNAEDILESLIFSHELSHMPNQCVMDGGGKPSFMALREQCSRMVSKIDNLSFK